MNRKLVAEFVGTFALVWAGTGAIMVNEVSQGLVGHIGIALTFGLIVMVVIYAIGHISGSHINPAVTLGFALARQFPWRQVPAYIGVQLLGAIAAAMVNGAVLGEAAYFGATYPSGPAWQSVVMEAFLTFFLMFVVMAVATDVRAVGQAAAIAIGATVALEVLFGGPISGAAMNPARSFGPALVGRGWDSHWVYWVGPMAGGALGALVYRWLRGEQYRIPSKGF